jgi:hypothetical protein
MEMAARHAVEEAIIHGIPAQEMDAPLVVDAIAGRIV